MTDFKELARISKMSGDEQRQVFGPMKNKKILMVGVLDVPSSTNVFMAKGFEQLGYEVEAYNYRTKANEIGTIGMWTHFKDWLLRREKNKALIVFCKTNSMHPSLLDYAKEYGPTWYWFMDPIGTAKAVMAAEYAKYATYASATSSEVVRLFKAVGVNQNSFHIIEGYDPEMYFYEDLEKKYDVTFIGNATDKRIKDIKSIAKAGIRICIFGLGWPYSLGISGININPPVFNEAERRVINQSKIVLNLSHDGVTFSDRIVKSLACGALVLSQYCKDLDDKFPCALSMYRTPEEAYRYMNLQLSNVHNISALQKRLLCKYQAVSIKDNYSWKAVCQQILEKVK